MDEQQQELAAFESSLKGEPVVLTAADPVSTVSEATQDPVDPPEQAAAPEVSASTEVAPAEQAVAGGDKPLEQPAAEDDPEVFDGFKRSELKRLLSSASEVEGLKHQLRKAHGAIGELKSHIKPPAAQAQVSAPVQSLELSAEQKQFEHDYPDVAAYIKAFGASPLPIAPVAPSAVEQLPVATGNAPVQTEPDPFAVEEAAMDLVHEGWRDTIKSQPFGLWLATQGDEVKQTYATAQTAKELGSVLGSYSQWSAGRQAAADKAAKGQQRLQRAVTPSGSAQRPQAALTEKEAFEAALRG